VALILGSAAPPCLTFTQVFCNFNHFGPFFLQDVKKTCAECPLECEQQTFSYQTSSLDFPSHGYYNFLLQQPDVVAKFNQSAANITYDLVKSSILRLNIYYESLSYTQIEETEKFELFDLIGGIGGTLVILIYPSLFF
jgi:hypothetical protein